ncbi:hypothetical protein KY285_026275 [Solanum tuberosum]|nr:hypothetical protein KY285_026275 [Solanum tuberosum]
MSSPSSPSKTPLSPEIENPNSFNFSTLLVETSPCTPTCGPGETSEFLTSHTEVVEPSTTKPVESLPCSPTLVLFGKKLSKF